MNEKKSKILLLEDDLLLCETLEDFLTSENFDVDTVHDGEVALESAYEKSYDLFLFDVKVPSMNGFDLLYELRSRGITTPAIFMTSLNSVDNLSKGFESGADDYLRKPFELKELLLRAQNILKREFYHAKVKVIELGENLTYEPLNNRLINSGVEITLRSKELKLLSIFLKHQNELLSHDAIYDALWDYEETPSETSLRTYIKNLRKILGKEKIASIKGYGYKFVSL